MTAQLYLVPAGALTGVAPGAVVTLDGDEGHHAATVKRARVGEELLLGDGEGVLAHGVVDAVETGRGSGKDSARRGGSVAVRVVSVGDPVVSGPRYILAQALAKGGRDELAVATATELGVDEIVPWQAARSIVTWRGDRGERSRDKWQSTARTAAKQSRRATVPHVAPAATTAQLTQRVGESALALVLHEDADLPLGRVELPAHGEVVLVVGPEGGIDRSELQTLTAAGAVAVRLGTEVLRASTAGPAALAVLCSRTRWDAF